MTVTAGAAKRTELRLGLNVNSSYGRQDGKNWAGNPPHAIRASHVNRESSRLAHKNTSQAV